jgi:hypothetical protein
VRLASAIGRLVPLFDTDWRADLTFNLRVTIILLGLDQVGTRLPAESPIANLSIVLTAELLNQLVHSALIIGLLFAFRRQRDKTSAGADSGKFVVSLNCRKHASPMGLHHGLFWREKLERLLSIVCHRVESFSGAASPALVRRA